MEREVFFASVHDAMSHLFDRAYLTGHPLARYLAKGGGCLSSDAVQLKLLKAIEGLRPRSWAPVTSPSYRVYQYLQLRYVGDASHEAAARELGLSLRQAHRVRLAALDAVAMDLWETHFGAVAEPAFTSQTARPARAHAAEAESRPRGSDKARPADLLDDELARLVRYPEEPSANLMEELDAALGLVEPLAKERGITIEVDAPHGTLPVALGHALLSQIIVLLLSHALEYQALRRIGISVGVSGGEATLDVAFQERVSKGSDQSPRSSVEDVRLSTARQLAEAKGARIESSEREGCRRLRLILAEDRAFTILVIDDNPDLARLFAEFVRGTPYRVIRSKSAERGVSLASQARPDVITLDVMMPLHDGWEILRRLRSGSATMDIPVIVCSVLPERDIALAQGAADFLPKPVSARSLIATVERCVSRRQDRRSP